jgi:hypothetical protein
LTGTLGVQGAVNLIDNLDVLGHITGLGVYSNITTAESLTGGKCNRANIYIQSFTGNTVAQACRGDETVLSSGVLVIVSNGGICQTCEGISSYLIDTSDSTSHTTQAFVLTLFVKTIDYMLVFRSVSTRTPTGTTKNSYDIWV